MLLLTILFILNCFSVSDISFVLEQNFQGDLNFSLLIAINSKFQTSFNNSSNLNNFKMFFEFVINNILKKTGYEIDKGKIIFLKINPQYLNLEFWTNFFSSNIIKIVNSSQRRPKNISYVYFFTRIFPQNNICKKHMNCKKELHQIS